MKLKHLIWLIILCVSHSVMAQKKTLPPPPPLPSAFEKKTSIFNKNYKPISLEKRLSKYPFALATKIKIISFNLYDDGLLHLIPPTPINEPAPIIKTTTIELPTIMNTSDLVGINQAKTLNISKINKLTDILYNTCSKYNITHTEGYGCYNPRNAIVFFDNEDKVFAYLEICFECNGNQPRPYKLTEFDEFCSYTYTELEKFFKQNGIETKMRK